MANLKRMSIKVSEELYDFIAKEAEKDGLSMNAVIIFALNTYKSQQNVAPNLELLRIAMEMQQEQGK